MHHHHFHIQFFSMQDTMVHKESLLSAFSAEQYFMTHELHQNHSETNFKQIVIKRGAPDSCEGSSSTGVKIVRAMVTA